MKLKHYLTEKKKLENAMIGYGIDDHIINPVIKHIKSWLVRYDISFEEIKEKHLTAAQILGTYDKDMLVRLTNDIDMDYVLTPKKIKILRGQRTPKDYIVIEYSARNEFVNSVKRISNELKTFKFNKIIPHISLFVVDQNTVTDEFLEEMKNYIPSLKKIRPKEIQIWNDKHEKEYNT